MTGYVYQFSRRGVMKEQIEQYLNADFIAGSSKAPDMIRYLLKQNEQARDALEQLRIMGTEGYLGQDGKSIVVASDFQDIQDFAQQALNNLDTIEVSK